MTEITKSDHSTYEAYTSDVADGWRSRDEKQPQFRGVNGVRDATGENGTQIEISQFLVAGGRDEEGIDDSGVVDEDQFRPPILLAIGNISWRQKERFDVRIPGVVLIGWSSPSAGAGVVPVLGDDIEEFIPVLLVDFDSAVGAGVE